MTLPADVARCAGYWAEGWREGCEDCQRRTSPPAGPDAFRRSIFLCPHEARRQRAEHGEVTYNDGPLPERGWD